MSLNGIALIIPFQDCSIEPYFFKYRCRINTALNRSIIFFIKQLEYELLNNLTIQRKPQYKLYEQVSSGLINFFVDNCTSNNIFTLKIYGIWFNETNCGLTYKFFQQPV